MQHKGKFITLEGGDGVGKTTHIQFLYQFLQQSGIDVVLTREPGGTKAGEQLRHILLQGKDLALTDNTELLLMFAARMQHIETLIQPALNRGQWVLCDRFTDATYAYQGGGRQMQWQRIDLLRDWVQQSLQPDKTFILDASLEIAEQRREDRGQEKDRFEIENTVFKQRVREAYLRLANENPSRIELIDAAQSIAGVQQRLSNSMTALLQ